MSSLVFWGQPQCPVLYTGTLLRSHKPEPKQAGEGNEQLLLVPHNWWEGVGIPWILPLVTTHQFIRSAIYLPCRALALIFVREET